VSEATCAAGELETGGMEQRQLMLRGRSDPISVRVLQVASATAKDS
jgi:hypothetical protein